MQRWESATPARLVCSLACFVLVCTAGVSTTRAQSTVGYVGYLADDSGPMTGRVQIEAELFAQETPGSDEVALWSESHENVAVDEGRFFLTLGSESQLAPDLFEDPELWLQFTIEGVEMAGRVQLDSVPYSFLSSLAEDSLALDGHAAEDFATSTHGHDELASIDEAIAAVDAAGYVDGPACVEAVDASGLFLRVDGTTALNGNWDVAGNQLLNLVVENAAGASTPAEPTAGQLWWDTDAKSLNVFDGASWLALGAPPSQADIEALGFATGAHADTSGLVEADGTVPLAGDWDVAGHQLLNLVVENAAGDAAPTEPVAGQLWWDTDANTLKVFSADDWVGVGISATREDIEALGFLPGSHTAPPTREDVVALGFSTGPHTSPPSREEIEALGFIAGSSDFARVERRLRELVLLAPDSPRVEQVDFSSNPTDTAYNGFYNSAEQRVEAYSFQTGGEEFFMEVEAEAFTGSSDAEVDVVRVGPSRWLVYSSAGDTHELNRAYVLRRLFVGMAAGSAAPNGTTGLVAIRSSDTSDRGSTFQYFGASGGTSFGCSSYVASFTTSDTGPYLLFHGASRSYQHQSADPHSVSLRLTFGSSGAAQKSCEGSAVAGTAGCGWPMVDGDSLNLLTGVGLPPLFFHSTGSGSCCSGSPQCSSDFGASGLVRLTEGSITFDWEEAELTTPAVALPVPISGEEPHTADYTTTVFTFSPIALDPGDWSYLYGLLDSEQTPGVLLTLEASFDGGTTFSEILPEVGETLPAPGDNFVLRVTLDRPAPDVVATVSGWRMLYD